jgi:hypothetical protein
MPSIAAVVRSSIASFNLIASLFFNAFHSSSLVEDGEAPLRRRSSTESQFNGGVLANDGVLGFFRINTGIGRSLVAVVL